MWLATDHGPTRMWGMLKALTPPVFAECYRSLRRTGIMFRGIYQTWDDACKHAKGYDADSILYRVRDAALKVRQGEAIAERDSVIFKTPQYPFPLIATLLRAAQENQGDLTVLDFGGSLGSSCFQCRDFLKGVRSLRWCIVEQPKFVACGQREFENDILFFYESAQACAAETHPQVVLLSGVLQYLAEPVQLLNQLVAIGAAFVVIDRTPILLCGKQVISVQHVPETINRSSYPVWLFNEEQLKIPFQSRYEEVAVFDAVDGQLGQGALKAHFKGFIFRRKDGEAKS